MPFTQYSRISHIKYTNFVLFFLFIFYTVSVNSKPDCLEGKLLVQSANFYTFLFLSVVYSFPSALTHKTRYLICVISKWNVQKKAFDYKQMFDFLLLKQTEKTISIFKLKYLNFIVLNFVVIKKKKKRNSIQLFPFRLTGCNGIPHLNGLASPKITALV